MRARVSGDTSERPLTTRDTVGTETPACRAISVIVTLFLMLSRATAPTSVDTSNRPSTVPHPHTKLCRSLPEKRVRREARPETKASGDRLEPPPMDRPGHQLPVRLG